MTDDFSLIVRVAILVVSSPVTVKTRCAQIEAIDVIHHILTRSFIAVVINYPHV